MIPRAPALRALLERDRVDEADIALVLARIECPHLDAGPVRQELARLGAAARRLVLAGGPHSTVAARIAAVNHLLYDVEGFRGNVAHYDDIRNCLLHCVLERRTGIPISLAVVYMTVARTAGLDVLGVAFPGHFLLRVPSDAGDDTAVPVVIDPFNRGEALDEPALRALLARHAGDAPWRADLLLPCGTRAMVVRMLHNMKRLYVHMRSFPQAWMVADLLVDVGQADAVRDRGLLACQLGRFTEALDDLEAYGLAMATSGAENDERARLRDHLGMLQRRLASLN